MTADAVTIRDGLRLVLTNDLEFSTLWPQKVPRTKQSSLSMGSLMAIRGIEIRGAFGRVLATTTVDADRQILNKTLVLYAQELARRAELQRARYRK
jgi:hypothetical protein